MIKWTKNTLAYWLDLYREIRIWRIFSKTAKANVDLINKQGLRVDWIGRVYTVVNLPEEVLTASPEIQQAYVLQKISEMGDIMMKVGLGDIVYPEIQKINGTAGWLVVLWPSFEALTTVRIIVNLFRTGFLGTFIYLLIRLYISNQESISKAFSWLASFF
jgi:hypothetical protein